MGRQGRDLVYGRGDGGEPLPLFSLRIIKIVQLENGVWINGSIRHLIQREIIIYITANIRFMMILSARCFTFSGLGWKKLFKRLYSH